MLVEVVFSSADGSIMLLWFWGSTQKLRFFETQWYPTIKKLSDLVKQSKTRDGKDQLLLGDTDVPVSASAAQTPCAWHHSASRTSSRIEVLRPAKCRTPCLAETSCCLAAQTSRQDHSSAEVLHPLWKAVSRELIRPCRWPPLCRSFPTLSSLHLGQAVEPAAGMPSSTLCSGRSSTPELRTLVACCLQSKLSGHCPLPCGRKLWPQP